MIKTIANFLVIVFAFLQLTPQVDKYLDKGRVRVATKLFIIVLAAEYTGK